MDIQSLYLKVKKGILKNHREYFALRHKLYPSFIFEKNARTLKDEIPVFTLHSVNPQKFEEQLLFLTANGYSTLTADEFYECLIGNKSIAERTILLTFDDGWKNLYTVAYPLLKKYKFCATCFVIPNLISEKGNTLQENINQNNFSTLSKVPDSDTLCNWEEIKEMHQSGVIDFQSHSMNHYLIFTSSKVVDFVHPKFNAYAMNLDMPLIRFKGQENYSRVVNLGTPIYEHASRFSGKQRYFDDENLRSKCTEYVKFNGDKSFFEKFNWRKQLLDFVNIYRKKENNYKGFYETESELRESIFNELRDSKLMIESKLHDKSINHFCYPWWEGSEIASEISREAGYQSNFWGVLPKRRTNRKGDDPYKISRILSDDYIFRLPGIGRKSLLKIISDKLLDNKNVFNAITK